MSVAVTPAAAAPGMVAPVTKLRERLLRLLPVLVPGGVFLVAVMTITPWPVGAFEDDAVYTVLAKALASGDGYRQINLPGAPYATHYPPGYPLVLAALWRVWPSFPDNVVLFKFANAVFLAVAALGAFAFGTRRLALPPLGAALSAIAGTLSVLVLFVTGVVMSEPLFLAMLFAALLMAERTVTDGLPAEVGEATRGLGGASRGPGGASTRAERAGLRAAALTGLLLGALTLVRTIGVAALVGVLAALLWRRQWKRAAAVLAASLVFLVPWQLWVFAHQHEIGPALVGKYGAYGAWLADGYAQGGLDFARAVVMENLAQMDAMVSYAVMPVSARWPRLVGLVLVLGLVVGGAVVGTRRAPATALFLAAYFGIVIVWPFEPDRFVLAVWPVLTLLLGAVVAAAWRWRARAPVGLALRFVVLGGAVYVVAGHAAYNWRGYTERWWEGPPRRAAGTALPLAEWVEANTAPDDLLSVEHDPMIFLYTGRRAIPTGASFARDRVTQQSPEEFVRWVEELLETYRPRYYLSGWRTAVDAAEVLSARTPPLLRRFATLPGATVYERLTP